MEDRSVFDLFKFDPVAGDPFQGQGAVSPVVSEFNKTGAVPPPPVDPLGSSVTMNETPPPEQGTLVGRHAANIVKYLASLAGGDESWSQYAGDPRHPMVARIGSAVGEEARRLGAGMANDLQQFMTPTGEIAPTFETDPTGRAGAGFDLASRMLGPGGESGVGAGWNPGAMKFLEGLTKQKPPLLPETASVVQKMIKEGPEWGYEFFKQTPDGTPGKGFAQIATTKHMMEEAAKPQPPPVVTPAAAQAAQAAMTPPVASAMTKPPMPAGFTSSYGTPAYNTPPVMSQATVNALAQLKALQKGPSVLVAQPGTGLPVTAGSAASLPLKQPKVASKAAKASTPLSPQQALFGSAAPAQLSQEQVNKLFSPQVPALRVPTMKPYDPALTGKAALSHETAPGTSGKTLPFNPGGVPMDQASKVQRMQDLGYGPLNNNILWWRGVAPHGPYSWDSAAVGYRDPVTKDYEPGLFLHPDVNAYGKPGAPNAQAYGTNLNPHVIKTSNPLVTEWKKVAKGTMYSKPVMSKIIKDAWAKGHDALLLKNIVDVGGNHDQLILRYPHQLRHPHAAFDPAYKDSSNLLAAGGTGGVAPMVVQDKDLEEGGDDEEK